MRVQNHLTVAANAVLATSVMLEGITSVTIDVKTPSIGRGHKNGHIRNDTRDVSRRISSPYNRPICRRNCVASDRW
jgi:hypothetical protein